MMEKPVMEKGIQNGTMAFCSPDSNWLALEDSSRSMP
jgi:hypothetical protein